MITDAPEMNEKSIDNQLLLSRAKAWIVAQGLPWHEPGGNEWSDILIWDFTHEWGVARILLGQFDPTYPAEGTLVMRPTVGKPDVRMSQQTPAIESWFKAAWAVACGKEPL